jgi:hypothetical protein
VAHGRGWVIPADMGFMRLIGSIHKINEEIMTKILPVTHLSYLGYNFELQLLEGFHF